MKKIISVFFMALLSFAAFSETALSVSFANWNASEAKAKALVGKMTVEEKVGQMIQAERRYMRISDITRYCLGSVLSGGGSVPGKNSVEDWRNMIEKMQKAAAKTRLGIPILYGVDAVHGHNNLAGAVIFPHNCGLGATPDSQAAFIAGKETARAIRQTGVTWTFAPCIAVAQDIRWGRTYESFSENPRMAADRGLLAMRGIHDGGAVSCIKHFAGDGGTLFGTSQKTPGHLDQGDTRLSEEEFYGIHLNQYKRMIDNGAMTVMASYSSFNGVKMHENKRYLTDILKNEWKFRGFVVSDYAAVEQCSGKNYRENVILCVNAGIDMLMEPIRWKQAYRSILYGVKKGLISEERINDAAVRILTVKYLSGLMDEPVPSYEEIDTDAVRSEARKAAESSFVLLKNEENLLPLKPDVKVCILGPAADSVGVLCGGWTIEWLGKTDNPSVGGKTLREAVSEFLKTTGGSVTSKPEEADVILLAVGEEPYAEFYGDAADLSLYGDKALKGNRAAVAAARKSGKPTVAVLVAGRPRIVTEEIKEWDAFVMAWLPGSEGADALVNALWGKSPLRGRLPFAWPVSAESADGKESRSDEAILFPYGFGL
ncbi:MAG: glycoside hydrolase family 3 protein [Spirochaetia bacterium]|nr:glycoside hydrolase family 3 protein [Spirochaetia bacterium]